MPTLLSVVELAVLDTLLPCDVAGEADLSPYERSGLVLPCEPASSGESTYESKALLTGRNCERFLRMARLSLASRDIRWGEAGD